MHENDRPVFGQYDIGRAGQVMPMNAEAIPEAMKSFPDNQFRFGVCAANLRHDTAAVTRRDVICHEIFLEGIRIARGENAGERFIPETR